MNNILKNKQPNCCTNYFLRSLTLFLLFFLILPALKAAVPAEEQLITLNLKNVTIKEVLNEIKKNSNYSFWYNDTEVNDQEIVSVNVANRPVEEVLKMILSKQKLTFTVKEGLISISKENSKLKTLKGKVVDVSGNILPGASIIIKGTKSGSVTDANGEFSISGLGDNSILAVSFIGMKSKELIVGNRSMLTITLEEDAISLNEVVAIGYGAAKKRDITGSISTVNADKLSIKGSASFDSNLQGLAAGVSIQSNSGVPGAASKIKIRGLGSINSSTDPLWIIDGMPVLSYEVAENNGTTGQSPMSLINQNDIENIQVLKDAASTAIYGSRASNGVIIVTTKSGKKGKGGVNVDFSSGMSDLTRKPADIGYANSSQWFSVMNEMYQNSGKTFDLNEYYKLAPQAFDKITIDQAKATNTDWYNLLFRKGSYQELNVSSTNATEKANYYVSLNYRNDEGVQLNNSLQRISGRANVDFRALKLLSLGAKMNFSYTDNNRMQNSGYRSGAASNGGLNAITTSALPWYPVYNPVTPEQYYNPYGGANPLAFSDPANVHDNLKQFRTLGNVYAEIKLPFIEGLSVRSEASFDFLQSNSIFWKSRKVNLDSSNKPNSYASQQSVTYSSLNYNLYATYDRKFGEHQINAVAGSEAQRIQQTTLQAKGQNLIGVYQELGSPSSMLSMYGGLNGERYLLAYFGRANYKYNDRYLLGASIRRDGSSAFTAENRWGNFASLSAGWILSEENFMDFIGDKTFIKLRGSFGQTGNQNIPSGLDRTLYEGAYMKYGDNNIMGVNGTLPVNIAVSDLKWETTNSTDIGIDFGFLDNRINGSVAYYNKYITNMLLQGPVPVSAGVGGHPYTETTNNIWGNLGNMTNSGFEFEIHSTNIESKSFKWTTDFNIAFNSNKINQLTREADMTGKGLVSETTVSRKDHKRLEWFMADYAGVDTQTGVPMIYAVNTTKYNTTGETERLKNVAGSDSLLYATETNIRANRFYQNGKSADPTYYGGLTNTFEYKGFDLSFLISFSGGNYIYDYDEQISTRPNPTRTFKSEIIDNVWRKPGDVAKYPKLTADNTYTINGKAVSGFGDNWVYYNKTLYKGDYIRLKNIQLGYNFPASMISKLKIATARVYVSGTNLFTVTDYKGFDPEGAGMVYTATIPQLKSIVAGLNIKF
jgi:TonB-linked SusC/RagA family outer membrane protein